jgi:predicted GNAT family acetyltransferase
MMRIATQDDPIEFRNRVNPFLRSDPSRNQLIFDLSQRIESFGAAKDGRLMWSVEDRTSKIQGAAIRTDAMHSLILSDMSLNAIDPIVEGAAAISDLDGVLGVKETAEYFQHKWSKQGLRNMTDRMRLRLYDLTSLTRPLVAVGSARLADERDLDRLSKWSLDFSRESLDSSDDDLQAHRKSMTKNINECREWVWTVRDEIVAMAVWTGKNEFGTKITGVYTPPEHRGHGYASNLVSIVTEGILKDGAPRAFIYTDLKNQTSNSIYQKLGYRHVCDYIHLGFAK